ncbi:MAG TPA: tRNA (guanosine(46)-N7)-methyltransferase TrmB [Hyphomicrobium sp.]
MPTRSRRPPPEPSADTAHELRSFGRRRGRKFSARQRELLDEGLPRLALDLNAACPRSFSAVFPVPTSALWLEIGFGGAEHLVWQARHNREIGLIGCEVFDDGVIKAVSAVEEHGLANIRLSTDDARDVLRWLPQASLQRVFILFPDPWPKKRHVKRRLVSRALFDLLARVMAPGAELRIATDIGDYARTILRAARDHPAFAWQAESPQDWRERGPDWPETRYEAKARGEGRRCYFLRFLRTRAAAATIPLPAAS